MDFSNYSNDELIELEKAIYDETNKLANLLNTKYAWYNSFRLVGIKISDIPKDKDFKDNGGWEQYYNFVELDHKLQSNRQQLLEICYLIIL